MIKQKKGRPPLPQGEKQVIIQVFVKKKNHKVAKEKIKELARIYNTV